LKGHLIFLFNLCYFINIKNKGNEIIATAANKFIEEGLYQGISPPA